ncbi:MAG: malonyl-CoA decarboxylase family protein [Pseudomonadales bacterium]|nr:malonyl-CoA decarboxylase family protein [Pseudomonadales bacterium]
MRINDWLDSIADAGRELWQRSRHNRRSGARQIEYLCEELSSSRGEAMGTAVAQELLAAYQRLDEAGRLSFFRLLQHSYAPRREEILLCAARYQEEGSEENLRALQRTLDGGRRSLFRRINMAAGGMATILGMRQDLLRLLTDHQDLKSVDVDLLSVLKAWFNRGFLDLRTISWETPAHILEKLIAYEAVHEMDGWDDLRRRLADDRRCFAFFHPALPDEPLIFVEIALVEGMSGNVQELLVGPAGKLDRKIDTAVFYSISNCQEGLLGISFGNFLIKQVVMELRRDFPELRQFVTLSPIPGFRSWLDRELNTPELTLLSEAQRRLLSDQLLREWQRNPALAEQMRALLMPLCAIYLAQARRGEQPLDAVERFHLSNGARIERLNWLGDTSDKGMAQSCGMLVNYGYLLREVEANHETYVNSHAVVSSNGFRKLLNESRELQAGTVVEQN